ncbi:MAG: PP2C family protein-serine/threonine phosphatase [Phycisphaerae bacterium]
MADLRTEVLQLRRILAVSREMATTTDLDHLLSLIIDTACEVLDCERATIFLYDPETDELYSRVAKGAAGIRFAANAGIAGIAVMHRECVNVADAYADPRFNRAVDKKTGFVTRNLLTFPLENLDGHLIGVLQALNKRNGPFGAADEQLGHTLGAQAGVALDRGRLIEEFAEKERMARDLDIARDIQSGLFPDAAPKISDFEVSGWNKPADECGGDTYDIIPLADGRTLIALADASGHGIGPALVVAQFHALLRGMAFVTTDVARICEAVNHVLCQDLGDARFVTAFIGILDAKSHRLEYVSCGQGPILHVGQEVKSFVATTYPLAIIPDMHVEPEVLEFAPRDILALFTDGFFEASNGKDELFSEQRVIEHIAKHRNAPLQAIISSLHEAVDNFTRGNGQNDDLTALLVRRTR